MGNTSCFCKREDVNQGIEVQEDPRKADSKIHVAIHSVSDFTSLHPVRIMCSLTEENIIILDENGFKCTFNTSFFKPARLSAAETQNQPQSDSQIAINEETSFNRDLNWILENQSIKRDLYLVFQLMQRKENFGKDTEVSNDEIGRISIQSNGSTVGSPLKQRGSVPSKNKPMGWAFFKLNTEGNQIAQGKFTTKLQKPPLIKPPFKSGAANTSTNIRIEFSVNLSNNLMK